MNHQQEAERLINLYYVQPANYRSATLARCHALITVNEILDKLNVDSKLIADYIKVKQILDIYKELKNNRKK